MPTTIPNLWPEQYKVSVQSPLTILRVQAGLLRKMTSGILEGDVETEATKERQQHRLVVIAPAYDNYRHTLITAVHGKLAYPAEVKADGLEFANSKRITIGQTSYDSKFPVANNDDEMQALVKQALASGATSAVIHSLLAQSNEAHPTNALQDDESEAEPTNMTK